MARSRFFFDSLQSAALGLIALLEHARNNKEVDFRFGPTSAPAILENGLWLDGQIDDLADTLEEISGAVRHDE